MTKTAPARGAPVIRKGPPEIAIEWIDVTIDIRVSYNTHNHNYKSYLTLFKYHLTNHLKSLRADATPSNSGVRARPPT